MMLDPWFVTGFCQAEAVFTYSRAGEGFNLYFSIWDKADNQRIVEQLRQFFNNTGNVYTGKRTSGVRKSGVSNRSSIYYRVARVEELRVVVEHFDQYPLHGKKQEAYQLWREMWLHKIENYRSTDRSRLKILAEQLSVLNHKKRILV